MFLTAAVALAIVKKKTDTRYNKKKTTNTYHWKDQMQVVIPIKNHQNLTTN